MSGLSGMRPFKVKCVECDVEMHVAPAGKIPKRCKKHQRRFAVAMKRVKNNRR